MTHTFCQLHYHLVWSTKNREPLILPSFQKRLYEYIHAIFKEKKCYTVKIGGMADHIHILVEIPQNASVAEIVRCTKVGTTKWLHHTIPEASTFHWQEGYGAFTVSASKKDDVKEYIQNQEEHHKEATFTEEFLWFLDKHGIACNEQYLWR